MRHRLTRRPAVHLRRPRLVRRRTVDADPILVHDAWDDESSPTSKAMLAFFTCAMGVPEMGAKRMTTGAPIAVLSGSGRFWAIPIVDAMRSCDAHVTQQQALAVVQIVRRIDAIRQHCGVWSAFPNICWRRIGSDPRSMRDGPWIVIDLERRRTRDGNRWPTVQMAGQLLLQGPLT